MSTDLDPGWEKRKRDKFPSLSLESDCTSLPGVTYLSDFLKPIDEKRQTGFCDNDLPQPFRIGKSYAHVPHVYLAPDGFPRTGHWLEPACQFAVLSTDKMSGKGRLVQRALDAYREQGYENVPEPILHTASTKQTTRHPDRAAKFLAAQQTDQSPNFVKSTYNRKLTRFDDPILPFEDYERTMEIINNLYTVVTHGRGQMVDRETKKLICTFAFEDLESMTTDERDDHQKDVTTILMATKLFNRLPTPCRPKCHTVPPPPCALAPPVPAGQDEFTMDLSRSLIDPTLPRCLLPQEPADDSDAISPTSSPLSSLGSSPLSSLPPSDSEAGDLGELMDLDSSPLSSLPPSDSEDNDIMDMDMAPTNMIPLVESSNVKANAPKPTTNGALIAGKMYCFGQTVGYSSDILISPYIPVKGSSKRLYKKFLRNLPGFGARLGARFRNFCDQGFLIAREELNKLKAPSMVSTSKFQPSGPLDFAANFAFTLCGFYNKPHTDNDKGKVYCLWYPIDSESGKIVTKIEGYYYEGGWFIFPEYRLAFNLGDKYAVQIAWNGKTTFHHTLPPKEKDDVDQGGKKIHYTRLGCSSQITQKMARACAKAGTKHQFNYRSNCERRIRDAEDILKLKDRKWKE